MSGRAIVFTGVDRVEVRPFKPREIAPGEVLIESAYTCVSPGTELRALRGGNNPTYPIIPGYALAGRVVQSRADIPEGARVFCTGSVDTAISPHGGGHVSHAIVPAAVVTAIPDEVELLESSTCVLAAIAIRGLRMSRPRLGETAVVVGLGVIGHLSARLHALAGARVMGCDRSAWRVRKLVDAGCQGLDLNGDLISTFAPHIGNGVELIIDATGVPAVLIEALALARRVPLTDAVQPDNRYLIQGSYSGEITFPYVEAFARQLTFLVPKAHQPCDRVTALELFKQKRLAGRDLIDDVRSPEAATQVYQTLKDPANPFLTIAFDWHT